MGPFLEILADAVNSCNAEQESYFRVDEYYDLYNTCYYTIFRHLAH